MAMAHGILATMFAISIVLVPSLAWNSDGSHLTVGFYDFKCPRAETIVYKVIRRTHQRDPHIAAGLMRLFFHDCFVKGCDASILLDKTPSGEPVEKESSFNGVNLRGLDVIDEIKEELERECPETVSCADILAFAARESVFLYGLPRHPVKAGRRDSRTSRASDIAGNLPTPRIDMNQAIQIFAKKGFSIKEMVVLLGAHSVGSSKCRFFYERLYNFSDVRKQDPELDEGFADHLKAICHAPGSGSVTGEIEVPFEPDTPFTLDNVYYKQLIDGKTLLQFDQSLSHDPRTSDIVQELASNPAKWAMMFVKAMIKLGNVDVVPGNQDPIRKNCRIAT